MPLTSTKRQTITGIPKIFNPNRVRAHMYVRTCRNRLEKSRDTRDTYHARFATRSAGGYPQ